MHEFPSDQHCHSITLQGFNMKGEKKLYVIKKKSALAHDIIKIKNIYC